ncbi:MAG: sigma-70 family RNA polymerase sigma factor [Pseudomonadota bacterium]|jgi:RNA polymerase sigma-70 factor (ECF subfamily)|uniref:sigma-70 family RNA polymerase sigma factor n=1 Tax=Pseudooceanicola nitratireducens TaxID=517719 RepID=UPI002E9C799A|nr:sigma-70 family RNA polymerase sigma factor [Pseudomonadota bacterium]MEC9104314.1 sigma-70 family RNA polymerase sigma factor [Pseudomonadota bacterium]
MPDRNDRWDDLLRRAMRGDAAAYAAFLSDIAPVIRGIVRARTRGAEDAEDIVQEVLLAVHAKRHTWREDEPVAPWLYAIARYKAADAGRRRGRQGGHVPLDDVEEVLPDAGGDVTATRDLAVMLDRLDARAAQIVRAIGVEGQSARDVGASLKMSEGAVRVAYHRAMVSLKELAETED